MRFVIAFKSVSRYLMIAGLLIVYLGCMSAAASAQSTEITAPTPVRTNDVLGAIAPRDIGDARLTDHFYAFTGTPGDLLITIEGRNLNGDVDVFNASGLRPLLKFSLYAGSGSPVTKSIYLRKREDLILRVEARSPNDDEGSYRVRFGGSFEPIVGGSLLGDAETPSGELTAPETTSGARKGRRVSSAGARIDEPAEIVAAPTETPLETKPAESAAAEEPAVSRTPARTPRVRRPPWRVRTRPPAPRKETATTGEAETRSPAEEATEGEPAPAGRRRGGTGRRVSEPTVEQEPEIGPRLIIETSDGTLINRDMATIRRVIVENGVVVVVGKDGKTQRVALANVTKMSIAP